MSRKSVALYWGTSAVAVCALGIALLSGSTAKHNLDTRAGNIDRAVSSARSVAATAAHDSAADGVALVALNAHTEEAVSETNARVYDLEQAVKSDKTADVQAAVSALSKQVSALKSSASNSKLSASQTAAIAALEKQVNDLTELVPSAEAQADQNANIVALMNDDDTSAKNISDLQAAVSDLASAHSKRLLELQQAVTTLTAQFANLTATAGKDGEQGPAGVNGQDGKDGVAGAAGKDGTNGVGIASTTVNVSGHLIVTLTDGTTQDAGLVKGSDGKDGANGQDGAASTVAGPQGPAGNANLASAHIVYGPMSDTPSNGGGSEAVCSAGEVAISGGFSFTNISPAPSVLGNAPFATDGTHPNAWQVMWTATGESRGYAFAVCAPTN